VFRIIGIYLLFFFSASLFAQEELTQFDGVEFKGNKRTKANYLDKFFPMGIDGISEKEVEQGMQWMRNLLLFSDVKLEHVDSLGQKFAKIVVKEKWTLLPVFNFDFGSDQSRFSLGFADYNFLGNASVLKGVVHRYDFTSFELFFSNPHFIRNKWGAQFELSNYNTLEPVYFNDGNDAGVYRFEKWVSGLILNREWNNKHRLFWGAVFLDEKYIKQSSESLGPDLLEFDKVLTKVFYENNSVNYNYHRVSGYRSFLAFETTTTIGNNSDLPDFFWKLVEDFRFYNKLSPNAYSAVRFVVGLSENSETPFPAFVQDSYVNVRGIGNRVQRGSFELGANIELRQTVLNRPAFVLEFVNFADFNAMRFAGRELSFDSLAENFQFYAGGGFRFHLNFLFQAILRLDVGFDMYRDNRQPQVLLGIGQFI